MLHADEPASGGTSSRPPCADARTAPGDAACCARAREEGYSAGVEASAGGVGRGRWCRTFVDSQVRSCVWLLVSNVVVVIKCLELMASELYDCVMRICAESVGSDDVSTSKYIVCCHLTPFYPVYFYCFRYAELRVKKKERDAQKLPALVMDRLGKLLYRGPSGSERKQYVLPCHEIVKSEWIFKTISLA